MALAGNYPPEPAEPNPLQENIPRSRTVPQAGLSTGLTLQWAQGAVFNGQGRQTALEC